VKKRIGFVILFVLVFSATLWAVNVLQTQPSTNGNFELSLIRAKVKGDVLTFQVIVKNTSSKKKQYAFFFKDVYYTDTKAKKKYYALKDTNNYYIAGPAYDRNAGGSFNVWLEPQGKAIFWIKFPAPQASAEEIDLYIPWALPFEGVKVER